VDSIAAMVTDLREEFMRSLTEARKYSRAWNARSTTLKLQLGDTHDLHIAKRDDLRLKEYMGAYTWHRDNASFCSMAINLLLNKEVNAIVGQGSLPAQRK
jgi:hypothetical protein